MSSSDAPPVPPGGFTVYDSYATDPRYARYFTYAALAALALATLASLPGLCSALRTRSLLARLSPAGLRYSPHAFHALPGPDPDHVFPSALAPPLSHPSPPLVRYLSAIATKVCLRSPYLHLARWTWSSPLTLANLLVVLGIPLLTLATLLPASDLSQNANRAGFLALATLPWLFLLGGKSTGLASVVGLSYDRLNFLHRYLGRATLALVLLHFGLWTSQFASYGRAYAAARLASLKETRGIMSLCFLLLLALPSFSWVRRQPVFGWRLFKTLHVLGFVGLLVGVNMHTLYAWPWTVGVIVIYSVDVASRLLRYRFKRIQIDALEGGITRLRIEAVTKGWRAGQHLRMRVFFPVPLGARDPWSLASLWHLFWRLGRPLESHPLTIAHGPVTASVAGCGTSAVLFCRAGEPGGWAADLWAAAAGKGMRVSGLVDGPYGGLPTYANVSAHAHLLLVLGGSGMSFGLAMLDEALVAPTSVLESVSLVWCVSEEAIMSAYLPMLEAIIRASGRVTVRVTVYLRAKSDPAWSGGKSEVISVIVGRCVIAEEVQRWVGPDEKLGRATAGGRTIVVCGPQRMITDVRNTVAGLPLGLLANAGGIAVYSEQFAL